MTQSPEIAQQALAYARHQAAKSLADLAALMERTGSDCARCLDGVSDRQASFSHGEEWSMKEVVGHMLGSGEAINREIAGLAAGREASPPGRTGLTAGGDRPIEELRRALAGLWAETGRLVASLPEDGNLERTWDHPWFGPLNFKEWIAFQRLHTMDHIQQMERLKEHTDYPEA
ncbi:MAG: DinB family protein [Dehalococcoidia bacterium]|nr:DinB family protein [Dehalococcoidia bacterium]